MPYVKIDNIKIGNLQKKNRDHKKYQNKIKAPVHNLQILLL